MTEIKRPSLELRHLTPFIGWYLHGEQFYNYSKKIGRPLSSREEGEYFAGHFLLAAYNIAIIAGLTLIIHSGLEKLVK